VSIAVLIACHNRKSLTVRLLSQLIDAWHGYGDFRLSIFLVDDKSSDGTPEEVISFFPSVKLIAGSGSLFWNRGMALAFQTAQAARQDWDYYLLLNDDLDLDADALATVIRDCHTHNAKTPTIMVGWVRGPDGTVSYGGFASHDKCRPMSLHRVYPAHNETVPADTFNANFVVLPAPLMEALGGLDASFHHAYGDIDLGLRAIARGATILVHPRCVGITSAHPKESQPSSAVARFMQRHGTMPRKPDGFRQYAIFMWRHGCRWMFPLYAANYAFKASCRMIHQRLKAQAR
jgi:GT2 family glycosyltransferase